ncbi:MAG: hypothetical protein EP298_11870 [Gammaproteobacteria bacterium]|nr:MAG: hypothetical protein EP298_11870 [Gammaproteobacteria bacterium]UTW42049.1 hypothetical protein KFE69_11150 [bacterium SCSIO 12844]
MKIIRIILISLCGLLGFVKLSYASADYVVYIKNNTNLKLNVQSLSEKCIDSVSGLPMTISPHDQASFTFEDLDGLLPYNCDGDPKNLTLYAYYVTSNNTGNAGANIELAHQEQGNNDEWASKVSTSEAYGGFQLTSATCNDNSCLNFWYYISGDFNYNLTIGLQNEISSADMKSIALGSIQLTNGYGKSENSSNIDLNKGPYIVHFSKTTQTCQLNGRLLSCDPGIGYTYLNNEIIFSCQQTSQGQSECPWVTDKKGNTASNVNVGDIYS